MDATTERTDAHPTPPADDGDPAPQFLTAADIAAELDVHIKTVRRWFTERRILGRKIGHRGWTTTRASLDAYLNSHPPRPGDYTAADIATATGVKVDTVYGWFRTGGLPGTKHRAPGDRGTGTWLTTRDAFDRWYATYLHGEDTPS